MPETGWQEELTARLRTLLRTAPLHRLEENKAMRAEDLSAHDLRILALRTIDAIIESMGMGYGASRDDIYAALAPLIRGAEPGADAERVARLVELVLDGLLNERERRRAFSEPYGSVEAGGVTHRVLSFHLVREVESPDGEILLQATTEGINLYAGMLAYDVEDAQTAEEAVLGAQLRRGKLAEAVATARRARMRSLEYEQKLLQILQTTRRDVRQIDWVGEVLALLAQARAHIEERLHAEYEIRRAIDRRLHAAQPEDAAQLVALRDVLEECIERHLRLQQRLISANQRYLDEQERQSFRPRVPTPLPDLEADLLREALELPLQVLSDAAPALLRWFHAPSPPVIFDLADVVDRLLAPRRRTGEDELPTQEADLERFEAEERRFNEQDHQAVEALLAQVRGASLADLLVAARSRGLSSRAMRLLTLEILQSFDPAAEGARFVVRPTGRPLADPEFGGDNLLIERRSAS